MKLKEGGMITALCVGLLRLVTDSIDYANTKAVIVKPVIDMSSHFPFCYNAPIAGQDISCRRANQGLFGELVDCCYGFAEAVKIDYNRCVYGFDEHTGQPYSTMWVKKNAIKPLRDLSPSLMKAIPDLRKNQKNLVLITPWNGFSVGTRFVRMADYDTQETYACYIPQFELQKTSIEYINKADAVLVEKRDEQTTRALFLGILRHLMQHAAAQKEDGIVAYVWGGCSYIEAHEKSDYWLDSDVWHRHKQTETYTGYDCSGLVWRIAQTAGIAFPWKVSKLIGSEGKKVATYQKLQNGDIIWVQGHVMIVSDIENSKLIEAAGYHGGRGYVYECSLHERFAGITTYQQLFERFLNNEPVQIMNAAGIVQQTSNIRFISLVSAE